MSYKRKLDEACLDFFLVTIERHGAPQVSGSVLSVDDKGATIRTEEELEVYIEFTSMRGVTITGWDLSAGD